MKKYNVLKHKKSSKYVFSVIVITIILISLFYIYNNQITNYMALNTKSPKEYYAYVMKKNTNQKIDELLNSLYTSDNATNNAKPKDALSNSKSVLSFEALFGDDFLSKLFSGTSISHDANMIRKAELKISNQTYKEYDNLLLQLSCNNNDFINFSALTNRNTKEMYFSIPELSDAFYSFFNKPDDTTDTIDESLAKSKNINTKVTLTKSLVQKILTKYSSLIIDEVESVTLEKHINITTGNITENTAKLSFSFTFRDLLRILNNQIEELSYDSDMENLIISSGICDNSSEYRSYLSLSIIALNMYLHHKDMDGTTEFTLWVNEKGKIVAQNIKVSYHDAVFNYSSQLLQKSTKAAYNGNIKYMDSSNEYALEYTGTGQLDGLSFDGSLDSTFHYTNYKDSSENINYNGSFHYSISNIIKKDAKSIKVNGLLYSKENRNQPFRINFHYDKPNKTAELQATKNNIDNLTIKMQQKKESLQTPEIPSKNSILYQGIDELLPFIHALNFDQLKFYVLE